MVGAGPISRPSSVPLLQRPHPPGPPPRYSPLPLSAHPALSRLPQHVGGSTRGMFGGRRVAPRLGSSLGSEAWARAQVFPSSSGCGGPALPLLGHALGLNLPRARLSVSQLQSSRPPALPRRGGPAGSFGSVGSGPRALSAGCWAVPELPRLCGRGRPGHWGHSLGLSARPGVLASPLGTTALHRRRTRWSPPSSKHLVQAEFHGVW